MNADEITLIRDMRRVLDKLPIDSSRVEIQLNRGNVLMTGTVKPTRSQPNVIVKDEMEFFEKRFHKDQRVKSLVLSLRFVAPEIKEHVEWGENTAKTTDETPDEENL
jgi:hypothetical protein